MSEDLKNTNNFKDDPRLNDEIRKALEKDMPRIERETAYRLGLVSELSELIEGAEQGDAEAQFNLGIRYDYGRGVEQDHAQAAQWYAKAAEQGHVKAQYNLGVRYANGEGVEQDHAQAAQWFAKAAEQGHADAQYNLGVCYANGWGVEQDHAQAAKWYAKAAEQGDADAQFNLGICYANGEGVERDYVQAVKWFAKAAEQGQTEAQTAIKKMCEDGDLWKHVEKAADAGSAMAQMYLGVSYFFGKGPAHDCAKAAALWRKAAEAGKAAAQFFLGYYCYYFGQGTPQDFAQAARWMEKAADQGRAQAQYKLAECYEYGVGVKQDLGRAKDLYEKAAPQVEQAKTRLERGNLGAYEPPEYSDYDIDHLGSDSNGEFARAVIYANGLSVKKMDASWAAAYHYRSFGRITNSEFPPQLVKRTMEVVRKEQERQAFLEAHADEREALIKRIKNPNMKKAYPKEYAEYQRLKSLHKGTEGGAANCRKAFLLMLAVIGLAAVNLRFGESIKAAAFMTFFHGLGQIPLALAYIGLFWGSALCIGETSRGVMLAGSIAGVVFGVWYYTNKLPVVPLVAACVFAAMLIMVAVHEKKSMANVKKFEDYSKQVYEPLAEKLRDQARQEYEALFGSKPGV